MNDVETLRFAHPFFAPHPLNAAVAAAGGATRMLDFLRVHIQPVPPVRGESIMKLSEIIGSTGADEIANSGRITFHSVGDTGRGSDSPQEDVSNAMARDYDPTHPADSPAFLYHLGDVIYGKGKDALYRSEFYDPYRHYPGKIVAIAGNHDGEVIPGTDTKTLHAFLANFCASSQTVPPIAGTIFRQTMNQPGVYWMLDAPFVHVIGLYSNVAENPGFITGTIPGNEQKNWLIRKLKGIKSERDHGKRKALVVTSHHPPFTSGGHSSSTGMLAEIDDACAQTGVLPDLYLSGHSHNYQRYTRTQTMAGQTKHIPYIVAGCGGRNDSTVPQATGQKVGDHVFEKSRKGYGFLRITIDSTTITVKMISVDDQSVNEFDTVKVQYQ